MGWKVKLLKGLSKIVVNGKRFARFRGTGQPIGRRIFTAPNTE